MKIRSGRREDIPALLAIYNYEVVHGVATLDLQERTIAEWTTWFESHREPHYPLLVVEVNGHVAGYATLSSYRDKEAFQSTVELSIYIDPDYRGQGIATQLMDAMLAFARHDDTIHLVVSVITVGNEASVYLHKRFQFQYCGTMCQVGYKHGAYRDIVNYTLQV